MNNREKNIGSLALNPSPRRIIIPAADQDHARPLRVAAYARVSSDSSDQLHSYAAQTAYFAKLINSDPNWTFVDVYADKGITGTSTEKREDFQRMMEDCRSGKIDRILVKSISRFARNTKESLAAVRELKSLDVSVYFEEQNIDTAQATGETLTAVFSALAQKESEAISERMRHSYQMRMQRGTFSTHCAPYGYRLVKNRLEVIEEEAVIIRQIFDRYLSGISMEDIAKYVERIIVMNHGHVAFDDTPKKVFAHYKELEKIGLAAPQMTYIMHALKEHGMDVDVTATTVEEARDTILAALGSQKKNGKKGAEVC